MAIDYKEKIKKLLALSESSNEHEAKRQVTKMEQKIMEIYHDVHGKWFGYCQETKEYTPAFDNPLMLKRVYEHKGYTMKGRYKHD